MNLILFFICAFRKYEVLHFTQYLQARANKIGCAVSSSLKEIGERDWRVTWLACNYSFGNLKTFPVYKSGAPASACKTGPNPKYSGLCSPAEQYPHVFWFIVNDNHRSTDLKLCRVVYTREQCNNLENNIIFDEWGELSSFYKDGRRN